MRSVKPGQIRLISMGGTIAFGSAPEGAVPQLRAGDLAPGLGTFATGVEPLDLTDTSSIALRDEHLLALARAVRESIDDGWPGVVISHGSDIMEETAYFLALTIERGLSAIVLTGAIRHRGLDGYDGLANMRAALITARAPGVADAGPVVVMSDDIHTARFVTKSHTTSPGAFTSATGPIGQVTEGEAALWLRPLYADFLAPVTAGQLPRVELVTMVIGMDPAALRAVIATHPDGIVIEGFGGGHIPPNCSTASTSPRPRESPSSSRRAAAPAPRCAAPTPSQARRSTSRPAAPSWPALSPRPRPACGSPSRSQQASRSKRPFPSTERRQRPSPTKSPTWTISGSSGVTAPGA